MRTPDFIIIGAMKCATSTLHEQLAAQPGIFMSGLKEPNFFSDDAQWALGRQWYGALYEGASDHDRCGESSTHYTKRPTYSHVIERMRGVLGDHVRFIYIMRHPIDRLISHYMHEWSQCVISQPIDEAIDAHPELIEYGRYAHQLQPYLEAFGRDRVLPVFMERLREHPAEELARVCRFIGCTGEPRWRDDRDNQNVSLARVRKSATWQLLQKIPGARPIGRRLLPKSVRDRIDKLWKMKTRPSPSENRIESARGIFDEDLAQLGEWLDLDLSCATFKTAVARESAGWSGSRKGMVA